MEHFITFLVSQRELIFFFFSKSATHPGFGLGRSEPCIKLYVKTLNYAKAVGSVPSCQTFTVSPKTSAKGWPVKPHKLDEILQGQCSMDNGVT